MDIYTKEPAFFPAVAAELFFEAEAEGAPNSQFEASPELDAELDAILALA